MSLYINTFKTPISNQHETLNLFNNIHASNQGNLTVKNIILKSKIFMRIICSIMSNSYMKL